MGDEISILCVDDEENVLKSLKRIFMDEEDYTIFTAICGQDGLDILEETPDIQIIVADYRMPGMNGVEFLQKVYEKWPDTIRIVLSGYADTASIVDAINKGHIYKFIPKPWNDDELMVTISNAIDRYLLY
ncbi:MAG: response regulator, partial [Thermodesulfobacteriota bacterium]|nr:response regulator [Thermodesulfobacteriota bacterium]